MTLQQQLDSCLHGGVCFVGLGNRDFADDGLGVCLAEALAHAGVPDVHVCATNPESCVGQIAAAGFEHVVFLDALEVGAQPGSAILLRSAEIIARYPQVSTHKLSVGTLAKIVEANGTTKAWLLGVQPESLEPTGQLSPAVRRSIELLTDLLLSLKTSELATTASIESPTC